MSEFNTCRLCKSTELLDEIFKFGDDATQTLDLKINYCIGLKVQLGDGLPSTICKTCIESIEKYYTFKIKCLEMDLKFKIMRYNVNQTVGNNITNIETVVRYSDSHHNKPTEISGFISSQNVDNNDTNTKLEMDITTQMREINKFNNLYQCELCGRLFKMKTVLEQHLMVHSGTKPFACQICPKTYARAENRKIHMRSHMGIKPYICEICGGSSTKRQDLIRHMKIHSDERKYSCPRCNRPFKRSSDVASHMRTHTGVRPYSCRTCTKTYTSHNGLRKHYKRYCTEVRSKTLI